MTSRRLLTRTVAERLLSGTPRAEVLQQLAAYIVDHKLQHQTDMIVNDVEAALADQGNMLVRVHSATPLNNDLRNQITDYVKHSSDATHVSLEEHIDSSLLGGVVIRTPEKTLDLSVAAKLKRLKTT